MAIEPMRVLTIYDDRDPPHATRKTIRHHLKVLESSPTKHDIVYFNAFEAVPTWAGLEDKDPFVPNELMEQRFDVIILHYTFLGFRTIGRPYPLWRRQFDWIRDFGCLKVAIPQDEGDFAELLDDWLLDLGVSVVFSVHYSEEGPLYPRLRDHATLYPCLPGYIHEDWEDELKKGVHPIAERPLDIVYRARKLPIWYGTAGRMKSRIADEARARAGGLGLSIDVSTRQEDVIFGDAWFDFLASGRAVLGAEGGYSVVDRRGEIKARVGELLRQDPRATFDTIDGMMPRGWDDHQLLTITPRHFEAVAARSAQILVEGSYKGILEPDRHYISVRHDFSDFDAALERVRDHEALQAMVERAHKDVCQSGRFTYREFARQIEDALVRHI